MNPELKALIQSIINGGQLISSIVQNKGFNANELLPAEQLFTQLPSAVSNASKAFAELKALDSAGEADLISFIISTLALPDAKVANVVLAGLQVAAAGLNFKNAIAAATAKPAATA